MAIVRSAWATHTIIPGGVLSSSEWSGAGVMRIPAGYLMVKNDAEYLYVALDLVRDLGRDPGTGDYFWFTVDINGNRQITPRRDVNYGLYPGQPNRLGRQYYLGPGTWTGLLNEVSPSRVHIGFGPSPNSRTSHRIWEMRLSLEELEVDLGAADRDPVVNFGLRVASSNPSFVYNYPASFYTNFSGLHQIILARHATPSYPAGTEGAVIGGVGLIPATQIVDGYATTDSSYYLHVVDAAFGSKLNLIGNRTTMTSLWGAGARKYRVLHREGAAGAFTPLRQSWSNYRWTGATYVLEPFGPDAEDKYPLWDPTVDYSIDDLLLQWQSVGNPAGIHQFQAEFFRDDGSVVPSDPQVLSLMVDNNTPAVDLIDILHDGAPVPACAIESMTSPTDGLRFRMTAWDAEGHLRLYRVRAFWGDGQSATIHSDDYGAHINPAHQWNGVQNVVIPPGEWIPPVQCAYQFRVEGYPRVTNGYHYIGYVEDTRHVTILKPAAIAGLRPKITKEAPFGMATPSRIIDEGEEPAELGG